VQYTCVVEKHIPEYRRRFQLKIKCPHVASYVRRRRLFNLFVLRRKHTIREALSVSSVPETSYDNANTIPYITVGSNSSHLPYSISTSETKKPNRTTRTERSSWRVIFVELGAGSMWERADGLLSVFRANNVNALRHYRIQTR